MGYTHYWTWKEGPDEETLHECIREMKDQAIQPHFDILANPSGKGEPIFKDDEVRFNGKAENDQYHESFIFPGDTGFNFTKTAQKPYDIAVTKCLVIARKFFPSDILRISSDGSETGFEQAKQELDLHAQVI